MSTEVWLGPDEAASASNRSVSTVRRLLRTDSIPGARRKAPGAPWSPWEIPISSLVQLGLCDKLPDDPKALSRRIEDLEAALVLVEADKRHLASSLSRLETLYERQESLLNRLERVSV
jgi:hypothetical protein